MPSSVPEIQHMVVLMMENRSFDHMLGYLMSPDYDIDGLTGEESNPDSAGVVIPVTSNAKVAGDLTPDPGHHYEDVNMQLFGSNTATAGQEPTMSGFVQSFEQHTKNREKSHGIMRCFSPDKIPVLTTLAREYAVCDRWFSSIPGPTLPNRSFIHSATSSGRLDMSPNWIDESKTIYELLQANQVSSKIYFHDMTMAMTFKSLFQSQGQLFGPFDDFLSACEKQSLPAYSFIEPQYNASDEGDQVFEASDQHPDHDVSDGERLIRDVYQAIWKNQALREKTLLLIVYDEHGGLYDHVPPPATVSPDDKVSPEGFDFKRLGLRVPAILISPYIAKGTICHRLFDHTSAIATARKLFIADWESNYLTDRDRDANTFTDILNLEEPRTDTVSLKTAEPVDTIPLVGDLTASNSLNKALTSHQEDLVKHAYALDLALPDDLRTGQNPGMITTEGQASDYLRVVARNVLRQSEKTTTAGAAVS